MFTRVSWPLPHHGQTTDYVVDSNNHTGYAQVLEEKNGTTGVVAKSYTLGHDVIAQQGPAIAGGDTLFLLYDGHGSTRGLVDATGQPLSGQVYAYDAFGNALAFDPAAALTSLLYRGEQTDAATGQQYLRARYYDPATGRFNRLDPFAGDPQSPLSLHKYLYAHANPIQFVDPSGRFSVVSVSTSIAVGSMLSVGDAFLRGEGGWDLVDDAVIGGVFGAGGYALFAANAGYRAIRLLQVTSLLVGTGFGVYGTTSAIVDGNYGLAAYRGVFTILGGVAFKAALNTLRLPQGFRSASDYNRFVDAVANGLRTVGADDASVAIRGSAVTGRSYHTNTRFGPNSDIDLAIASEILLSRAQQLGLHTRSGGQRTGPLGPEELARLGLADIADVLSSQLNRPVSLMIYRSPQAIIDRGAAWFID